MEASFLGDKLISNTGEVKVEDALSAPVIAVYFSAHWCPPCRGFTPILAENYKKWNAEKKRIEIIFISRDRDQKGFDEYFKDMPWLAIPFTNSEVINKLKNKYKISGIPSLIIVDKKGEALSIEARDDVDDNGEGAITVFEALYK